MFISFGELLVDMIKRQDEGEEKFHAYPGGAPANFSVALARLGLRPKLIASVGKDTYGDMLLNLLEKENVDITHVKRSNRKTTQVFVELKNTVPKFTFRRGADVDMRKKDIDEKAFINALGFHFGSLSLTENPVRKALFHCLQTAKMYGLLVSFSPNIRSDLWHHGLDAHLFETLRYVDVFISSKKEFRYMFGSEQPRDVRQKYGFKKLVITEGGTGCTLYPTDNGEPDLAAIQHSAFPVETIDTTGAGDAFAAGFAYSLLKGKENREAVRFASAVAALSTTKKGAMSGLPVLKEVERFLKAKDID